MENLYLIVGGVIIVALVIWSMLTRVTARGGEKTGDASKIVGAIVDQSSALRSDAVDREPWDGVDRLKTGPGDPGGIGI